MFFKGSNFYLQITHFYDFIQAWTDVTHFFKVSLENFPQSEHLYGFINMETLKFFQECSLTILNLYHKHEKGNSSKYELTVIFDSWIFNTTSKKMDTKLLFLIEFSCVLSKSKVNSSKYERSLDLLSLTVESLLQTIAWIKSYQCIICRQKFLPVKTRNSSSCLNNVISMYNL